MTTELTLYHDGHCPLCAVETARLRRFDREGRLGFVDIRSDGFDARAQGLDPLAIEREIHGRRADGELVVGVPCIVAAYRLTGRRRFAWLGVLESRPALAVTAPLYRWIARHRYQLSPWLGYRLCGEGVCHKRSSFFAGLFQFLPKFPTLRTFKTLPRLTVYYDGACPLCSREIAMLRRQDHHGRFEFIDLTAPGFDAAALGRDRAAMQASLHAQDALGHWHLGADAVRALYRRTRYAPLIAPLSWPLLRPLFDRLYDLAAAKKQKLRGRCDAGCSISH